jgi:hypothetical protein
MIQEHDLSLLTPVSLSSSKFDGGVVWVSLWQLKDKFM